MRDTAPRAAACSSTALSEWARARRRVKHDLFEGVHIGIEYDAQRVFGSSHAAGNVRTGDVAAMALLQRLHRYRILDFIFVDNDAAIARGWAQGFPKKLASVYQTRSFSAPSRAAAPLTKGSRFGASVSAHGERLATARIQLEEKVRDPSSVFNRPTVMRRYFPQLAANHWAAAG
jgi:hypothetical protein